MKKDKKEKANKKNGTKGAFARMFGRGRDSKAAAEIKAAVDRFDDNSSDSIDDAMVYGRQAAFYGEADDTVQSAPVISTATDADLGDALASAIRNVSDADSGVDKAPETTGRRTAVSALYTAPAVNQTSRVSWDTDDELEALLRASSTKIETVAAEEMPEKVTTEDIAVVAFEAQPEEIPPELMADDTAEADIEEDAADSKPAEAGHQETSDAEPEPEPAEDKWAEFYEGLEDMFKTE